MIFYHNLNPILLDLGPLQIRWYGLMYVVSFVVAYFLLTHLSRKKFFKLPPSQIEPYLFYCFIGLFVGARFFYVFVYNFNHYISHPLEIFAFWKGGLSFHGGLLGIFIATLIFGRKQKISFWNFADNAVLAAPLGIFCVRIGNFINGELYGRMVTSGKWGVVFKGAGPFPRHPSQLYEAFFEGLVLFGLMWFLKGRLKQGRLFALFFLFYGIFRFFIEYFREPDVQLGFIFMNLSMGQILCLIMMFVGILLYFYPFLNRRFLK